MSTRIDTIHDSIILDLNKKIDEKITEFTESIIDKKRDCEDGMIPNGTAAFESFLRSIRKLALSQFIGTKMWLGTHVLSSIIQQVRTSGIYKLHEEKQALSQVKAEMNIALEERQRIIEEDEDLSNYEKYLIFGNSEYIDSSLPQETSANDSEIKNEVSHNVEMNHRKYILKTRRSIVLGIIITAICIAIDLSLIYALFVSANYSTGLAMIIAVISAAMLDAPPYVFGYIWTKNDDDKSLMELQGNSNSPEAKRINKGNRVLLIVMLFVIMIAFLAYLSVRILSFMGGGDFDLAFHAILEKDWSIIKKVVFSGADFLSTIVPLATSVVALAVGKVLYASKTDYYKETVAIINKKINDRIKKFTERIIGYNKQINDLNDSIMSLKGEIWTFYYGKKPFVQDENTFSQEVSIAFQKLNLSLYNQTYCDCCLLLRKRAETFLETVNNDFAQYAADQANVITMTLSNNEINILDDFWVPNKGEPQHKITESHLEAIKEKVEELLKELE